MTGCNFENASYGLSLCAETVALATANAQGRLRDVAEVAVIGGAEIYAQWMANADRLELTEVHAAPDGDTRFPLIDLAEWQEVARERHPAGPRDSVDFSYVTYRRRQQR